jgi:hypothetical protein
MPSPWSITVATQWTLPAMETRTTIEEGMKVIYIYKLSCRWEPQHKTPLQYRERMADTLVREQRSRLDSKESDGGAEERSVKNDRFDDGDFLHDYLEAAGSTGGNYDLPTLPSR